MLCGAAAPLDMGRNFDSTLQLLCVLSLLAAAPHFLSFLVRIRTESQRWLSHAFATKSDISFGRDSLRVGNTRSTFSHFSLAHVLVTFLVAETKYPVPKLGGTVYFNHSL